VLLNGPAARAAADSEALRKDLEKRPCNVAWEEEDKARRG
jgi:hypothetical protein